MLKYIQDKKISKEKNIRQRSTTFRQRLDDAFDKTEIRQDFDSPNKTLLLFLLVILETSNNLFFLSIFLITNVLF